MAAILFYLAAVGLIIVGAFLSRKTRPRSKDFSQRSRQSLGHFFIFLALLPLGLGFITQFFSSKESPPDFSSDTPTIEAKSTPSHETAPSHPSAPDKLQSPEIAPAPALLDQAIALLEQNQSVEAMSKVEAALKADPKSWGAFFVRGNIYALNRQWAEAKKDYQTALQLNATNVRIKFNLADIDFMQKKYASARPGFLALEQDSEFGDICTYKVFLCDLYSGHPDVANQELEALNQVGAKASYYFANAAWSLYQHKADDAHDWIASASRIYSPAKFNRYASSLTDLGYPDALEQASLFMPDHSVQSAK